MKKTLRLSVLGALAAAVISCSMFDYSGMVVHKYALVYGISRYTMAVPPSTPTVNSYPNLVYPDSDASELAALLQAAGYTVSKSRWVAANGDIIVDGSNVGQIGSPSYDSFGVFTDGSAFVGQAPTKATIIQDIQNMSATLGPNDVLVVYFSGHGTQDASTPPREYFDPYQGVAFFADATSPDYYADPGASMRDDDLRTAFDTISTPRKVLVLDTCNSGGFIGNQLEADWTSPSSAGSLTVVGPGTLAQAIANYASMQASPTGLSPYGAQVLSAAGRDELSYETSSLGHGVMTYYFLQGLQNSRADLNGDGHVTVLEAFAYAKAGVDQNWNSNSGVVAQQATFEPHISGGPVDFVLF